jgi:Arc/MetJ family transcription regulator
MEHTMSRTNIVLDSKLVEAGMKLTGMKTKRQLVDYALRELLRHEKQSKLLELQGKIEWEGNLDCMRTGRAF